VARSDHISEHSGRWTADEVDQGSVGPSAIAFGVAGSQGRRRNQGCRLVVVDLGHSIASVPVGLRRRRHHTGRRLGRVGTRLVEVDRRSPVSGGHHTAGSGHSRHIAVVDTAAGRIAADRIDLGHSFVVAVDIGCILAAGILDCSPGCSPAEGHRIGRIRS